MARKMARVPMKPRKGKPSREILGINVRHVIVKDCESDAPDGVCYDANASDGIATGVRRRREGLGRHCILKLFEALKEVERGYLLL
jgi:hypothetical protein